MSTVTQPSPADQMIGETESWHVDAAPGHLLVHGWMLLEKAGDAYVIREHAGGGTDLNGVQEPLDLGLRCYAETSGGREFVHLEITRRAKEKRTTVDATPSLPANAAVHVRPRPAFKAVGEQYQVLWQADVTAGKANPFLLVYVARLVPVAEKPTGFEASEANKALRVVQNVSN